MSQANVLLLVTGGIAAYKSCHLTRLLARAGFSVRVAMTASAQRFVGHVTLRALSGHPVAIDLWGEGETDLLDHVNLARWADVAVVAPATANLLGKAAGGIADDMVTTLLLACEGELVLAPAMNDGMWRHPAVQANLELLRERGAHVVEPGKGWLACGVEADGRMAEPEDILDRVVAVAGDRPARPSAPGDPARPLAGRRLLVTAGPTRESLDAIRYVSNRSTGAMGVALARQAAGLGAEVTLIHGPLSVPVPAALGRRVAVETAAEMAAAVGEHLPGADLLLMSAAVADFAPASVSDGKLKKESLGTSWNVPMMRTVDILAEVVDRAAHPGLTVVGFALETKDLVERALEKLRAKDMDFIVANDPTAAGTFGDGVHEVLLIGPDGVLWESGRMDKRALARDLLLQLAPRLRPVGGEA
ncbi:bifunctional phosphopantothenoylcysteine decarboxylase/phosphopantothenate--cysteine ligase CoaBC [bacterium]|nr:bifunctional phosphopantothenoylcysteine decarboxylase/phosphopantothenate--cysteine ligase CoaBC [bacterium]